MIGTSIHLKCKVLNVTADLPKERNDEVISPTLVKTSAKTEIMVLRDLL